MIKNVVDILVAEGVSDQKDEIIDGVGTAVARLIREKLKQRRQTLRLKQADLADSTNLKQPAISRLESGDSAINLKTLQTVASALDLVVIIDLVPRSEIRDAIRLKNSP